MKVGVSAYVASSIVSWLKEGGIQFINQKGTYVIKIHKTLGVIDVFRLDGHLKNLDVFGGDWFFIVLGLFSSVIAMVIMKGTKYVKTDNDSEPTKSKSPRKLTVKRR